MPANNELKIDRGDILIVDDEISNLKLLTQLLSQAGHQIRATRRPQLAIESALAKPPSLILLDVKMPEMDGFQLCERLKQDERTRDIPIIFVSALQDTQDRVRGFKVGGVDFISKPFQESEILARIKTHLQLRTLQLDLEALVADRTAELTRTNEALVAEIKERKQIEMALQESRQHFQLLFERHNAVMLLIDPDSGEIVDANPAAATFYGYSVAELRAMKIADINKSDPEQIGDLLQTTKNEILNYYIFPHRLVNGEIRTVEVYSTPIDMQDRTLLFSIIHDITERKRVEDALKESVTRLQLATAATHIGHWDWDLPTNEVYFSPEWKRHLGYEDHEIPNRSEEWESRLHPDDRQRTLKAIEDYIAGRKSAYEIEFRLRHKDGSYRWIYTRGDMKLDDTGSPRRIFGCHVDISERKHAEERLKASEERLSGIVDAISDPMTMLDKNFNIIWANDVTKLIFGPNILGKKCHVLYHQREKPCEPCLVRKTFGDGKVHDSTIEAIDKDGNKRTFWSTYSVAAYDEKEKPSLVLQIARDITERKRAEEAIQEYQQRLRALASQSAIAEERERRRIAGDLHDRVGQSLAFVRMQLAVARKSTFLEKRDAILDDISESLLQTVQDTREVIYDLSPPQMNEIGLAAAISEWMEEQIEKRHGLKTEFIDCVLKKALNNDLRAILFRNVRELLTNVVKHAHANKVSVCLEDTGANLKIIVQDDGVGFPPHMATQNGNYEGGFGLFSILERMSDLGGSLEIESEPGKGCKAILTVPLSLDDDGF